MATEPIAILYEHADGRRAVVSANRVATFAIDNPDWHRAGTVEIVWVDETAPEWRPIETAPQPAVQQGAGTRQEPVAWQSRTRPTWGSNTIPWYPWESCTKEQAEDYWKTPLLHGWAYEARALYIVPQPAPVAQGDAEQRQLDAKHAAIYRWMLSNVAEAWNIINNWCLDAEAGTDELHDALAARAQAKEGDPQ